MGLAGPGGRNTGYKYTKPKKVSSKAASAVLDSSGLMPSNTDTARTRAL